MSVSLTGRRYARRASVERIRRAQAVSSAIDEPASPEPLAEAGLQMKIRRRLGESPLPVALYGPLIVTLLIAGCVPRLRIRGLSVASSRASLRWTNVTPINFGPAFSVSGNSIGPAAAARPRPPARPPA